MTSEEAIYILKNSAWLGTDEMVKAIDMAIETLNSVTESKNGTVESKNDVIKRQDAIECCSCLHPEDCWAEIKALPSADAVEVVRCKDCKNRGSDACPMFFEEWFTIDEGDGYVDDDYREHDYTTDEGYCHRGERREDGEA